MEGVLWYTASFLIEFSQPSMDRYKMVTIYKGTKAQGALITPDMLKQTFEVAFLCHIKGLA
jgi:hypothetical protein